MRFCPGLSQIKFLAFSIEIGIEIDQVLAQVPRPTSFHIQLKLEEKSFRFCTGLPHCPRTTSSDFQLQYYQKLKSVPGGLRPIPFIFNSDWNRNRQDSVSGCPRPIFFYFYLKYLILQSTSGKRRSSVIVWVAPRVCCQTRKAKSFNLFLEQVYVFQVFLVFLVCRGTLGLG